MYPQDIIDRPTAELADIGWKLEQSWSGYEAIKLETGEVLSDTSLRDIVARVRGRELQLAAIEAGKTGTTEVHLGLAALEPRKEA